MRVLCLGEMMVELACASEVQGALGFGGDTFNTAVYLARLGQPTGYLTALGDDAFSALARQALHDEGVDAGASPTVAGRTMGLYAIRTDAAGERSFTYWRDRAPARDLFGAAWHPSVGDSLMDAEIIYLSGITLWLYDAPSRARLFDLLAAARQAGARIAFDGNYRPRLWSTDRVPTQEVYARMLGLCDICLATQEDEAALWDDADVAGTLERLSAAGIPEVVVKTGGDGAWVRHGGLTESVPTLRDPNPVDTTAAGDSFNAAYLDARLRGRPPAEAADAGNRLARRVIGHRGALIPRGSL